MRVEFSEGTDRLTRAFPKLSRQLKKCAAHILEHPSEVATFSMRELAKRVGVPPSTMNRLAKALGFSNYEEFRALYRDSINDQSAGYSFEQGQVQVVARESEFDHALNTFQQVALNNINTLFDHIDRASQPQHRSVEEQPVCERRVLHRLMQEADRLQDRALAGRVGPREQRQGRQGQLEQLEALEVPEFNPRQHPGSPETSGRPS